MDLEANLRLDEQGTWWRTGEEEKYDNCPPTRWVTGVENAFLKRPIHGWVDDKWKEVVESFQG